jgi:hypothetical protein
MPQGPKGEKRPADVIGNAIHVMRIATGEIEEEPRTALRAVGRAPRFVQGCCPLKSDPRSPERQRRPAGRRVNQPRPISN